MVKNTLKWNHLKDIWYFSNYTSLIHDGNKDTFHKEVYNKLFLIKF